MGATVNEQQAALEELQKQQGESVVTKQALEVIPGGSDDNALCDFCWITLTSQHFNKRFLNQCRRGCQQVSLHGALEGIIMTAYADVLGVLCDSLPCSFQGKLEETNAALEEESAEKASLQSSLVEATDEIQAKEQMLEESNSQTLTLRSAMAELKQEAQEMAVEAQAAAVSAAAELRAANENAVKVNADLEKERKRSR